MCVIKTNQDTLSNLIKNPNTKAFGSIIYCCATLTKKPLHIIGI